MQYKTNEDLVLLIASLYSCLWYHCSGGSRGGGGGKGAFEGLPSHVLSKSAQL